MEALMREHDRCLAGQATPHGTPALRSGDIRGSAHDSSVALPGRVWRRHFGDDVQTEQRIELEGHLRAYQVGVAVDDGCYDEVSHGSVDSGPVRQHLVVELEPLLPWYDDVFQLQQPSREHFCLLMNGGRIEDN